MEFMHLAVFFSLILYYLLKVIYIFLKIKKERNLHIVSYNPQNFQELLVYESYTPNHF